MKKKLAVSAVFVLLVTGFFVGRSSAQVGEPAQTSSSPNCLVPAVAGTFKGIVGEAGGGFMVFEDSAGTIRMYKTYAWQNIPSCSLYFKAARK